MTTLTTFRRADGNWIVPFHYRLKDGLFRTTNLWALRREKPTDYIEEEWNRHGKVSRSRTVRIGFNLDFPPWIEATPNLERTSAVISAEEFDKLVARLDELVKPNCPVCRDTKLSIYSCGCSLTPDEKAQITLDTCIAYEAERNKFFEERNNWKQVATQLAHAIRAGEHWCVGGGLCTSCNAISAYESVLAQEKGNG